MDLLCKAKASQASFLHVSAGQGTHQASRGCDHPILWCRLGQGGWGVFLVCLKLAQGPPQRLQHSYFEILSFFLCLGFAINQIIWLLSQSFNIKQFILALGFYDQWKALNQSCQQCCFYLRLTMINENVYDLSCANFCQLCQVLPTGWEGDRLQSTLCITTDMLTDPCGQGYIPSSTPTHHVRANTC